MNTLTDNKNISQYLNTNIYTNKNTNIRKIHKYKYSRGYAMEKKSTQLRVPEEKKMKLEKLAIEISYKTGKPIKWTELAFYLFDNYATEAAQDLKSKKA